MATYRQIQDFVKSKYGHSVKTCWIAHVKDMCGLEPRIASNRQSESDRSNPCPPEKVNPIMDAFRHFGMI